MTEFLTYGDVAFEPQTAPEAYLLELMRNARIVCDHRPEGDCRSTHRCRECGDGLMIVFVQD